MKVTITKLAEENLYATADYIQENFGNKVAMEFLQEFRHTIQLLEGYPQLGPTEPLLTMFPSEYRSVVIKRLTKMVYRILEDHIEIADIWDCRREPKTLANEIE